MSEPSLNQLERDVEAARAKLASDLATLRSPATFSEFTEDLKVEALDAKDALIEKAKSTATSTIQQVVDDLKAKAAANPGAALAIGAGLAWRLIHRPPIATALVGAGLYSLLRTTPAPDTPYMGLYDEDRERVRRYGSNGSGQSGLLSQATEMADTVKEKVQQWGAEAGAAAQNAATDIKDKTAALANQASNVFDDAQQTASEMVAKTAAMASHASAAIQDTLRDEDARDKILLGAAALAVAAAVGISYRRHADEPRD